MVNWLRFYFENILFCLVFENIFWKHRIFKWAAIPTYWRYCLTVTWLALLILRSYLYIYFSFCDNSSFLLPRFLCLLWSVISPYVFVYFFLGFVGSMILCVGIFQYLLFLFSFSLCKSLSHFLSYWIPDQIYAGCYNHLFTFSASHSHVLFSYL